MDALFDPNHRRHSSESDLESARDGYADVDADAEVNPQPVNVISKDARS